MRLYLDTNVIIDIMENRDSSSYDLLLRSLLCQYKIVLSSTVWKELGRTGHEQERHTFVKLLENNRKVIFVHHEPQDLVDARTVPTHAMDALHYVLARRHADALVTRNLKDFPFTDLLIDRPERF